jgi:hypothetical protein
LGTGFFFRIGSDEDESEAKLSPEVAVSGESEPSSRRALAAGECVPQNFVDGNFTGFVH